MSGRIVTISNLSFEIQMNHGDTYLDYNMF